MKRKLLLYLFLATLTQCSKCKTADPQPQPPKDPLSTLPPETQTGMRTLGCLVNGKAYSGPYSTSVNGDWQSLTNLGVSGDLFANGKIASDIFSISILLHGSLRDNQQFLLLAIGPSATVPAYTAGMNQFTTFSYCSLMSCYYNGELIKSGRVDLVKFDPVARIAAGRFSFTLPPALGSGCDTLRVTNGRFDIKF